MEMTEMDRTELKEHAKTRLAIPSAKEITIAWPPKASFMALALSCRPGYDEYARFMASLLRKARKKTRKQKRKERNKDARWRIQNEANH